MCIAIAMGQANAVHALLSAALARSIGAGVPVTRTRSQTRVVVTLQLDDIAKHISIKGTHLCLQICP